MDIRALRAFVAVFDARNITQAAQVLHLTQPTLSASLRALEEELGVSLFVRQPRGVAPTDAAGRLYPQAKRLIADADALARRFREDDACLALTLGVEADLDPRRIGALARVAAATPALLLTLADGCTGDARVGCESLRCEDELFEPLWEEEFVLALPPGHRLSGRVLSPAALGSEEWVMCPAHASQQKLLAHLGEYAPAHPQRAASLALAAAMAGAGVGVAWLPEGLLPAGCGLARFDAPPLKRRVGLCFAPDALAQPALAALLARLSELRA